MATTVTPKDAPAGPRPLPPAPKTPSISRDAALPAQEPVARTAAPHRRARARAARHPDRARGLRVRQPLVVGVRDRGDPARAHPGGRRRGVLARRPDHGRAARRARFPDPVVPGDDQGVPDGRRRVHGDARQLRSAARAGRRRRAAHRLRPHRGGVGRGGHRRARVGVLGARAVQRARSRSRSSSSSRSGTSKGVRESGQIFAVPTYFFIAIMVVLLAIGVYKMGRRAPRTRSACTTRARSKPRQRRATASSTARRSS